MSKSSIVAIARTNCWRLSERILLAPLRQALSGTDRRVDDEDDLFDYARSRSATRLNSPSPSSKSNSPMSSPAAPPHGRLCFTVRWPSGAAPAERTKVRTLSTL